MLKRTFYRQKTLSAAKALLGKIFVRNDGFSLLKGTIVETEAYLHNDPACHAYNGKTERNKVMFNDGGYLYVYFTYGMHYCANIVTDREGIGEAVLIRAVEPIDGIDVMMKRRKHDGSRGITNLTNGPAKFAQAFGLTTKDSGSDLTGRDIYLFDSEQIPASNIVAATRIGISTGKEKKWRFYIAGNPWVSKK